MRVTPVQFFRDVSRYLKYDLRQELLGWVRLAVYYTGLLAILVFVAIWLVSVTKPLPPKNLVIADGQMGSAYQDTALKIKENLAKLGFNALLKGTAGQVEGFQRLTSDTDNVEVSLLTAGVFTGKNAPHVRSLGSVGFSPIWIFYRGAADGFKDPFEWVKGKKIAIGPEGSITHQLYKKIAQLSLREADHAIQEFSIPNAQAAERLLRGEIDAAFIVDALESPNIQSLIQDTSIKIFSFEYADAYAKQLPYLQKLIIPAGSFNLHTKHPAAPVQLIASPIDLLVSEKTHPAMQWALLMAVQKLPINENNFFAEANALPLYLDKSFPLSDVAERFYSNGVPALFHYMPISIASLIDHIWIYMIGFLFVIKPLFNKIMKMRSFNSDMHLDYYTKKIQMIDDMLAIAKTKSDLEYIIQKLAKIENAIDKTWFDESDIRSSFSLETTISKLRKAAEEQLKGFPHKGMRS